MKAMESRSFLLPGTYGICEYALDYRDEVRQALLRFKFSGMAQYARGLAHFMLPAVDTHMHIELYQLGAHQSDPPYAPHL